MLLKDPSAQSPAVQRGFALLDALISILVLAIAVIGMLGVQVRTLSETQTGVRRGQAVRLIEDLSERIKSNSQGFQQLANYQSNWTVPGAAPPAAPKNCATAACTEAELALWDAYAWKNTVAKTLPQGDAWVFLSTDEAAGVKRQLGVMVAWHNNERSSKGPYNTFFGASANGTGNNCPAGLICHLSYVQPVAH